MATFALRVNGAVRTVSVEPDTPLLYVLRNGRGFAFSRYKNLACHCAVVVNQIEGGVIQSASWILKESVRFDRTRVTTRSWADYPIVRFAEVPEVEVVLLDQPHERFLGVGEGSQGPAAAAIVKQAIG